MHAGEGETAMHNWKKSAKRLLAGTLCAACFASVCLPTVRAAQPTIPLEYDTETGGARYDLVAGERVKLKMTLPEEVLNKHGENSFAVTKFESDFTSADGENPSGSEDGSKRFKVAVNDELELYAEPDPNYDGKLTGDADPINKVPENFSIVGRHDIVTTMNGASGNEYMGDVSGKDAASNSGRLMDATLKSQVALSESGTLTFRCTKGGYDPDFELIQAGGAFEKTLPKHKENETEEEKKKDYGYVRVDMDMRASNSTSTLVQSDRTIQFTLRPSNQADENLIISFQQPLNYDYRVDDKYEVTGGDVDEAGRTSGKYLYANGTVWRPDDYQRDNNGNYLLDEEGNRIKNEIPKEDQQPPRVTNNYFRKGAEYTLIFEPMTTSRITVTVYHPEYVVSLIEEDIAKNPQNYFKFEGADTATDIQEDTLTLTTRVKRFNAYFDIDWRWNQKTGQETAIDIENNTIEQVEEQVGAVSYVRNKIAVKRDETQDITGDLKASVRFHEEKDAVHVPNTKDIIVPGLEEVVIPGGARETLQTMGQDGTLFRVYTEADSNEQRDPEKAAIYWLATNNLFQAKQRLDAYPGDAPGSQIKPKGKSSMIIELDLGLMAREASQVIVTATNEDETKTEVPVRLSCWDTLEEALADKTEEDEGKIRETTLTITNDERGDESKEHQKKYLVIHANGTGNANEETAKVELDFRVPIHSTERSVGTYTGTISVVDSSPSKNSALEDITVFSEETLQPVDFTFDPARHEGGYKQQTVDNALPIPPITVPYSYKDCFLKAETADEVASIEIRATDRDGNAAEILKDNQKKLTSTLTGVTKSQLNGGIYFELPDHKQYLIYVDILPKYAKEKYGKSYVFVITRATVDTASTDNTLERLNIYTEGGQADPTNPNETYMNLVEPSWRSQENLGEESVTGVIDWIIDIPYEANLVRIDAAVTDKQHALIAYSPTLGEWGTNRVTADLIVVNPDYTVRGKNTYKDNYHEKEEPLYQLVADTVQDGKNTVLPCLYIKVKSEMEVANESITGNKVPAGPDNCTYRIFFRRSPPSDNANLQTLTFATWEDVKNNPTPATLPMMPNFGATDTDTYHMTVPYSADALCLRATPAEPQKVLKVEYRVNDGKWIEIERDAYGDYSAPFALSPHENDESFIYNMVDIHVTAQDKITNRTYTVQIEREPAGADPDLIGLAVTDEEGTPFDENYFRFFRDETKYTITLPYEVRRVRFQATLNDPNGEIRLRDSGDPNHTLNDVLGGLLGDKRYKLTSGVLSEKAFNLNEVGDPRTFTITGIAEDGKLTKDYVLVIDREKPSQDALLKNLTATNVTEDGLSPIFKAKVTQYTATLAEGQNTIIVTPTANDPLSTIRVNGEIVASGTASQPIDILEEYQDVIIDVTAQDGETTMTYAIKVFNQNLVEKTSNADLKSLTFSTGLLTPKFQPAVVEYELAVKEDVYSINIFPEVDDPMAQMKVLSGSRELGDYNGNFAMALKDGQNDIKIQVTSPDKKVTKEYTIKVYRNKEDSLKNLTPLKKDDIDFAKTENPITISLVEYPRIQADVFTELRDNYPDKTLVLQGVDYSLTFNAATLDTIIPQRQIYDFSMSFSSPNAENVYRFAEQWPENDDILNELVMIYFDYHGDLPGPATLNLSLSNKYGAQPLFWHYYNEERDRIDYYGVVQPNVKGTFAVAIDHFSTYVVSRVHSIVGAENQEGNISFIQSTIAGAATGGAAGANGSTGGGTGGSPTSSSGKPNPATLAEPKSRKVIP